MSNIDYDAGYGRHGNNPITAAEKANWTAQVQRLSNEELLEEYRYFSGGDDYDGCYSGGGEVVWEAVQEEFYKRLTEVGYLKED